MDLRSKRKCKTASPLTGMGVLELGNLGVLGCLDILVSFSKSSAKIRIIFRICKYFGDFPYRQSVKDLFASVPSQEVGIVKKK